ncbi:hypothetical protein, partial [Microcoleus sp. CAWBG27]|uniref:hypothetical protein n=1 Tax=Microcoleus sp. CAWBG27 TaxID=2841645 RepID=UPI0025DCDD10
MMTQTILLLTAVHQPMLTDTQLRRFEIFSNAYVAALKEYPLARTEDIQPIKLQSFQRLSGTDTMRPQYAWRGSIGTITLSGSYSEQLGLDVYSWFSIEVKAHSLSDTPEGNSPPFDLFSNAQAARSLRNSLIQALNPGGYALHNSSWTRDGFIYRSKLSISLEANSLFSLTAELPVRTDLTNILSLDDAFAVIQDELPLAKGPDPKFMRVEFTPGLSGNNMKKDAPDYELTSAGKGVAVY